MNMDKQIVFYNSEYQFYYSPKNKTISAPQISGRKRDDYAKNRAICFGLVVTYWIVSIFVAPELISRNIIYGLLLLAILYVSMTMFFKVKMYFDFSLKWIWYILFVPFNWAGLLILVMTDNRPMAPIIISYELYILLYEIIYISVGAALTCKKSIGIDSEEYVVTHENKKILREVLRSNIKKYNGIIIFEMIVSLITLPFLYMMIQYASFDAIIIRVSSFLLPIYLVIIIDRNIYYQIVIRKIAKQYGISLKSKDVIAENDAEAEKQVNAENKANEEHGTNTKNISTTENEMNAEINTAKEIVTENKATAKNETNLETNTSTEN